MARGAVRKLYLLVGKLVAESGERSAEILDIEHSRVVEIECVEGLEDGVLVVHLTQFPEAPNRGEMTVAWSSRSIDWKREGGRRLPGKNTNELSQVDRSGL